MPPLSGYKIAKKDINQQGGGLCPPSRVRDVKGFALKTHEGLRPSTLRAFKKARAKLLSVFGKLVNYSVVSSTVAI